MGSGAGFLSFILHDMGVDVTGIDLSRGMLTQAKEASRHKKSDIDLCQGDAESLPFQFSTFDLVASRHLLWTLPDPARALAEWMRVLRPGGRILAIDGNWFDPAVRKKLSRKVSGLLGGLSQDRNPVPFRKFYEPIEKHLPLYQASRPDQYLDLFEVAGLRGVTLDRLHEVNHFYRRHKSLPPWLDNADTVFLVNGEKSGL